MKSMFRVATVACMTCTIFAPLTAHSQSKDWTAADYAVLPEACRAKLRPDLEKDAQLQKAWSDKIGNNNYLHIHHYCFGLWDQYKARMAIDKSEKAGILRDCVRQFDYVLRFWSADSILRPDAAAKKLECEMQLKLLR